MVCVRLYREDQGYTEKYCLEKKEKGGEGVCSLLECLPSIYEARVQSPALKKRKNRKEERKKMTEFQSSGSRVV